MELYSFWGGGMLVTQYIYPQNLRAKANLWLWGLRDSECCRLDIRGAGRSL